ncbi:hypothetical protein [Vibrio gallicus]|uniref:hypothetical protein n=1 Tax=Vibrio gallicus TaxID=190897 RepID=UPI0021C4781A|nr:hypothetical protein [Vibrio gallicus]
MKLLADKTGEQFLQILEQNNDDVIVQFISNEGMEKGVPFKDTLKGLSLAGWSLRTTSTVIGLSRFKQGICQDAHVSFALHQLFPLGRMVQLPNGDKVKVASYANTHSDGYYMYVKASNSQHIQRLKITPDWVLLPDEKLLRLPYFPKPRTEKEWHKINEFDRWAGGF